MLRSSPILIWTLCAAVLALSICKAPARDLGQWEGADPLTREWFNGLMRPDEPDMRCCGLADAYCPHIENGKRFAVPNIKIKWDRGNPTGHGIIFIGYGEEVYCYLPPGGG